MCALSLALIEQVGEPGQLYTSSINQTAGSILGETTQAGCSFRIASCLCSTACDRILPGQQFVYHVLRLVLITCITFQCQWPDCSAAKTIVFWRSVMDIMVFSRQSAWEPAPKRTTACIWQLPPLPPAGWVACFDCSSRSSLAARALAARCCFLSSKGTAVRSSPAGLRCRCSFCLRPAPGLAPPCLPWRLFWTTAQASSSFSESGALSSAKTSMSSIQPLNADLMSMSSFIPGRCLWKWQQWAHTTTGQMAKTKPSLQTIAWTTLNLVRRWEWDWLSESLAQWFYDSDLW